MGARMLWWEWREKLRRASAVCRSAWGLLPKCQRGDGGLLQCRVFQTREVPSCGPRGILLSKQRRRHVRVLRGRGARAAGGCPCGVRELSGMATHRFLEQWLA